MSTKALKITPEQNFEIVEVNGFRDMQDAVEGLFTVVSTDNASIFVNDEGLLMGLTGNRVIEKFTNYGPLVGNALVMGEVDEEGNETDVSPEVVKQLVDLADDSGLATLCAETAKIYAA